jgi:hypothetical protein
MESKGTARPLREIAADVRAHWPRVNYGAVPYLEAMETLTSVDDKYYEDSGDSVVRYFLANAGTWRGPDAKRVKAELHAMVD